MGNSGHGTTYIRVGGDDEELRPWHQIYVYSINVLNLVIAGVHVLISLGLMV